MAGSHQENRGTQFGAFPHGPKPSERGAAFGAGLHVPSFEVLHLTRGPKGRAPKGPWFSEGACFRKGKPREPQREPKRNPRETKGNPRRPKGNPKETQGNPREPNETQGNPRGPKGNPKKPNETTQCRQVAILRQTQIWTGRSDVHLG